MKSASTGKTSPTELFNDPDNPSTRVSDWEGAVLKQGGVVVGRSRNRSQCGAALSGDTWKDPPGFVIDAIY